MIIFHEIKEQLRKKEIENETRWYMYNIKTNSNIKLMINYEEEANVIFLTHVEIHALG